MERRGLLLDVPNDRSSHRRRTVRGAGVIFSFLALAAWSLIYVEYHTEYLPRMIAGACIVTAVSFVDDLRRLPILPRLLAHLGAALLFLSAVPVPSFLTAAIGDLALIWWPLAAFFMVAVINIYNFMDGADGLAGLHSSCAAVAWVLLGALNGILNAESLICLAVAFPLVGFLLCNWQPARVFMGDAGSTFLGFTFACLAVIQVPGVLRSANFSSLLLLMMPFLFDATFVLLVRLLRGERWYEPHNQHLFQRLVRAGFSHAAVSSMYGGLTLYMGGLIYLSRAGLMPGVVQGAMFICLPYVLLYLWVVRLESAQAPAASSLPLG